MQIISFNLAFVLLIRSLLKNTVYFEIIRKAKADSQHSQPDVNKQRLVFKRGNGQFPVDEGLPQGKHEQYLFPWATHAAPFPSLITCPLEFKQWLGSDQSRSLRDFFKSNMDLYMTLCQFYIAIENGTFISDVSVAMLVYQRVVCLNIL